MSKFKQVPDFPGLVVITPTRHNDARGYFTESYNARRFADAGISETFVQDNCSRSFSKGTIRGLHFQTPPYAQAKLVSCTRGRLLDVVVDIRSGSPSFGRHFAIELSTENGTQLFVPTGFAHGFCTLVDNTEITYKVSDFYEPGSDAGLSFDDATISIDWPVFDNEWILSEKDRNFPKFSELDLSIFQFRKRQTPKKP